MTEEFIHPKNTMHHLFGGRDPHLAVEKSRITILGNENNLHVIFCVFNLSKRIWEKKVRGGKVQVACSDVMFYFEFFGPR